MKLKMHIQNKKLFRRISALVTALVICGTLVVSAFADLTSDPPFRIIDNGTFAVSWDNTVYTYQIPNKQPSEATGSNYLCVLVSGSYGSLTDEKELLLLYIQFSSSDWSFVPSNTVVYDSRNNICFSGTLSGSATASVWYAAVRPNALSDNNWYPVDRSLGNTVLFYSIYASSKPIVGAGMDIQWIGKSTYNQGFNGAIGNPLDINSFMNNQGGLTVIQPNTKPPVTVVYDGDLHSLFYGFVDGMWSGLWQGYDIFSNGIAIGGYTLHNLIVNVLSVIVMVIAVVALVKVIKG